MKKIILVIAAVVIATCTQAASVKWNVNAVQNPAGTGAGSVGWVAAIFIDDAAGTLRSSVNGETDFSTLLASASQTVATVASGTAVRANGTTGSFSAGETAYVFALVLDSSDVATAENFYLTSLQNKTVAGTGADITISWVGTNAAQGSWSPINVPEPTSGLLLLIGMSGLALKRKRA